MPEQYIQLLRAKWFVQQNKVKLNAANKYYEVTDEKDYLHNVRLMPSQYCSCLEKTKCCHIYAAHSGPNFKIRPIKSQYL